MGHWLTFGASNSGLKFIECDLGWMEDNTINVNKMIDKYLCISTLSLYICPWSIWGVNTIYGEYFKISYIHFFHITVYKNGGLSLW